MPKTGSGPYTRSNISDAIDQYGGDVVMTSTTYLNYGRFTMSDDKDEIDWEFTRGDSRAESNTFSKGVFNSKVQVHEVGNATWPTSANFHVYGFPIGSNGTLTTRENLPLGVGRVSPQPIGRADFDLERRRLERRLVRLGGRPYRLMIECLDDLNKPRPTAPPRRGATLTKLPFSPPTTTLTTVTATTVMVTVDSVVSVTDATGGVTLSTEQVTKPAEAAKATSGAFGLGSSVIARWSLTAAAVLSSLLMVLALDL
ncbi:hypothetical protein HDU96_000212 [Phlyctochytrium bullatum]|nr:hypothetical protein HDU96_000212 [Phlyctochytrium bullatum]